MFAALMVKCFEPYLLPGVPGAINDKVEHRKTIVFVTKLVEKGTGNGARHTTKGDNVDNTVEVVFGVFHSASHT